MYDSDNSPLPSPSNADYKSVALTGNDSRKGSTTSHEGTDTPKEDKTKLLWALLVA